MLLAHCPSHVDTVSMRIRPYQVHDDAGARAAHAAIAEPLAARQALDHTGGVVHTAVPDEHTKQQ
jgi:hypothetical protein